MNEIEIVPGITVRIDPERWAIDGGLSLSLTGTDHEITVSLVIRDIDTDQVSRVESVLQIRTA